MVKESSVWALWLRIEPPMRALEPVGDLYHGSDGGSGERQRQGEPDRDLAEDNQRQGDEEKNHLFQQAEVGDIYAYSRPWDQDVRQVGRLPNEEDKIGHQQFPRGLAKVNRVGVRR